MYGKDFFVGVDLKVYVDIDVKLRWEWEYGMLCFCRMEKDGEGWRGMDLLSYFWKDGVDSWKVFFICCID